MSRSNGFTQRNAMMILDLIVSDSLTERDLRKKTHLYTGQIQNALGWIENNICLLAEDEQGRIQIYQE